MDSAERAIAIVGVGAMLPDAPNAAAFWNNIHRQALQHHRHAGRPLEHRRLLRPRPQSAGQDLQQDRRLGAGL
jgi:acyl transferase domain-containing protein